MAIVLESASIPRDSTIPGPLLRSRSSLPRCSSGLRLAFPSKSLPPSDSSPHLSLLRSRVSSSPPVFCEQKQGTLSAASAVTDTTWKEVVLKSDIPVLVDFWAAWCGPCRMIAPIVDELAKEYTGRIKCVKLNTDENPNTATEYGIRSIPTVMIFVGGQKKDTIIGAVPKNTLVATVEKFL